MATRKLSDAQVRAARAVDKAIKLSDGEGLFLWVSPTGAKSWRWSYRYAGKQQTAVFGQYPDVSLARAREILAERRGILAAGDDPSAVHDRQVPTLAQAVAKYFAGRRDLSAQYLMNATRCMDMHILPKLGARPINQVTRKDLLDVLGVMDAKGLSSYVRKARMWVAQVFDWAIEQEYIEQNPAASIRPEKAFSRTTTEHFAALELTEMPEFMGRLGLENPMQRSVLALRFLLLTWTRTSEMRLAEWSEIDGDVWRIPGRRMKMGRDHVVPLSEQALTILDTLRFLRRGDRFIFESDIGRDNKAISENAVLYLLYRMGYRGRMTGHGCRTIASTWANERGFPVDAIERQLAHAPDDKVRAAYNRAEYLPARRKLMQAWADWLDQITPRDLRG